VELEDMLPLPPHLFHVLLALRGGPLHGYAIKKAVLERSAGRIALDAGGLYRLIARLVDNGAIEEVAAPRGSVHDDRTRIYYKLTRAGERLVALEARRLAALVASPDVRALLREVKG
jgi:DNA-binding PadR family transcriptional regulator